MVTNASCEHDDLYDLDGFGFSERDSKAQHPVDTTRNYCQEVKVDAQKSVDASELAGWWKRNFHGETYYIPVYKVK